MRHADGPLLALRHRDISIAVQRPAPWWDLRDIGLRMIVIPLSGLGATLEANLWVTQRRP
jgi:hypothetical protein